MAALASIEDLNDRIPAGIASGDEGRAQAVLDDASALIRSEAGKTWDDETVPDVIRTVCLSAARRAFLNPDGISALAIDGHSASFTTGSPDVYLTKAEIRAVRRAAGRGVLWTQPTTRSDTGELDTPSVRLDDEHDSGPLSDFFPP